MRQQGLSKRSADAYSLHACQEGTNGEGHLFWYIQVGSALAIFAHTSRKVLVEKITSFSILFLYIQQKTYIGNVVGKLDLVGSLIKRIRKQEILIRYTGDICVYAMIDRSINGHTSKATEKMLTSRPSNIFILTDLDLFYG